MTKKKEKMQVINNIGELNFDIDYDKLATAIVKALEKTITDANQSEKFTSGTFAMVIVVAFRCVAILGWILAIATSFAIVNMVQSFVLDGLRSVVGNVLGIAFSVALFVILVLYSVLLWKSAKEIETEKDRNYIIAVFSGIVSFAALIVVLVALFKGV